MDVSPHLVIWDIILNIASKANQYPASVPEDKQPEEHNSAKRAGDVSSVAAQIGKVVEELVRDTLGDKVGVDHPARRSPRRRRVENMEVKLQKENEPTQHRDFILVWPPFSRIRLVTDGVYRAKSAGCSKTCSISPKTSTLFLTNLCRYRMSRLSNPRMVQVLISTDSHST